MKNLLLFVTLVNVTTIVLSSSLEAPTEIRKTSVRSPSPASNGTPALVNSLQSSQDTVGKSQSAQVYSSRIPASTADYNAIQTPHTLYSQHLQGATTSGQPTSPTGHGSYLIALNSNGAQPTLMPTYLTNGATPVIMQYLPHNGQSNGIQYLQLIPTRPLIVPISPYISSPYNQYNSQYHAQQSQYSPQSTAYGVQTQASPYSAHPSSQYSSQPPSTYSNAPPNSVYGNAQSSSAYTSSSPNTHTLATAASTYATIPTAAYHPPTTHQNYGNYQPTLQSPIGGYSTNVYSYFRPHSGVQMISSPLDLSLNTNEYLPLQGESGYRMSRRP